MNTEYGWNWDPHTEQWWYKPIEIDVFMPAHEAWNEDFVRKKYAGWAETDEGKRSDRWVTHVKRCKSCSITTPGCDYGRSLWASLKHQYRVWFGQLEHANERGVQAKVLYQR